MRVRVSEREVAKKSWLFMLILIFHTIDPILSVWNENYSSRAKRNYDDRFCCSVSLIWIFYSFDSWFFKSTHTLLSFLRDSAQFLDLIFLHSWRDYKTYSSNEKRRTRRRIKRNISHTLQDFMMRSRSAAWTWMPWQSITIKWSIILVALLQIDKQTPPPLSYEYISTSIALNAFE